jgi:glycosyltransferase involved in cell wall biosynthesis
LPGPVSSISMFVPFQDELEALPHAVRAILDVFGGWSGAFELILVDDGSRDGSGPLADALADQHDAVRVVRHTVNRGYGAALSTGFAAATGDIVCYSDADLPVEAQEFFEALPLLDDADLVVGYPRGWTKTLRRRTYTAGYRHLVRLLLGLRVRDVNFSFKLIRRELLDRIELDAETGFVDAELLVQADRLGGRIVERGVPYCQRKVGSTHFDSPLVALATGRELLRWWWANRGSRS